MPLLRTVLVALITFASFQALAQVPELPPQWFQERIPSTPGAKLSFCIDSRIAGWELNGDIADAIADLLLIEHDIIEVDRVFNTELDFEMFYVDLVNRCTAYLGLKVYADSYPEWIAFTQPMYETRFVLISSREDISQLADFSAGSKIGVVQGSEGDIRFLTYNNMLPQAQRWRRIPLGDPPVALEALLSGSADALIIWEPDWHAIKKTRPEFTEFRVIDAPLISEPWVGIGAALVVDRTFEITLLDEVIRALTDEGTIGSLISLHDFPARSFQP